mgnify:CR=1 FL=1
MANQIKLKRGLQKNLPSNLQEGEVVITTDTNKLYSKNGLLGSNVEVSTTEPSNSGVDVWLNPSGSTGTSDLQSQIDVLNSKLNALDEKKVNSCISIVGAGDYTLSAPGGAYVHRQFPFDTTFFNSGDTFERSGSTIVAKKDCLALVMFSCNFDGQETIQCMLRRNQTTCFIADTPASGMTNTNTVTFLLLLNAGDVIDVTVGFGSNTSHLARGQRSYLNAISLLTEDN